MELTTIGLPVFTQLANVIFEKAKMAVDQSAANSGLFKMESVPGNTGNIRQYTEIDLNKYASKKGEGDQAKRAKVLQGYSKNLQSYRVATDIGITYEMRTQNKYSDVISRITNLANQAMERKELDLQHRITFGAATTYTDMDGDTVDVAVGDTLALFYTAHTIKSAATTYRNILANNPQLSRGALELMEKQAVENSVNQFGEKVRVNFDVLWTTDDPNTVNTALEYLRSVAAPDVNNSGVVNVYKGKYKHVILPLVATDANGLVDSTKAKYWGIASTAESTAHVLTWEEARLKTPSQGNNGEEFSTDDFNFGVRAGYGIAIVNAQWIHMSKGDATA
jgi:hypothetical protein